MTEPFDPRTWVAPPPFDPRCQRWADDMAEYDDPRHGTGLSRAEYVRQEEGTYNPDNGHFLCDQCYIDAGMPSSPSGWRCP